MPYQRPWSAGLFAVVFSVGCHTVESAVDLGSEGPKIG